jgi:hypothetical protein
MVLGALAIALAVPRLALAQGHRHEGPSGLIQGFGAIRISDITMQPSFGGNLGINLTPHVQAVGEFGRMNNVLPAIVADALSLAPGDLRVTAMYGEGGVRILSSPYSAASPYVEATGGMARLRPNLASSIGDYTGFTNLALRFLDRTEPIASVGGGIIAHAGPAAIDLGYRFTKVFTNDPIQQALSLGGDMIVHQVRIGLGVRF